MAAPTTTDQWDEYLMKLAQGGLAQVDSWNVGLYSDATDAITSADNMAAITTEPTGTGYNTKTVTPSTDATVAVSADATIDIADQTWSGLDFGSATEVDAFYISLSVQLDGDAGATEHLMAVGTLNGGPYDLSDYTDFTATDTGVIQTQG